jgi:hypothetical protein
VLASLLGDAVAAQSPPLLPPPPMPVPVPPGSIVPVPGNLPAPPVVLTPAPPMSHREFARIFKPMPGRYEVTLIHPGSHRPVHVCFTLPEGCPHVVVRHRELVFDYGHHHQVVIRFALFGHVRVVTR